MYQVVQSIIIDGKVQDKDMQGVVEVIVTGDLKSLKSDCSITVNGNILGDVDAGGSIKCGNIGKNADSGGSISCANINGNADAGGSIKCSGDIKGSKIGAIGNNIIVNGIHFD